MASVNRLRKHPKGAAIILVSLALLLNTTHLVIQVLWVGDPFNEWARDTVENLQSEVWQIALAAWVFAHFYWRGSPESKDTPSDPE